MLNGRLEIWQLAWNFFRSRPWNEQALGLGLGSCRTLLPRLTIEQGGDMTKMQIFFTLHNDWGQLLFETGWIGLLLAIVSYVRLFLKARRRNQAVLLGFGAAMLGNPVLHFLPTALILFVVIWEECLA